MRCQRERSRDSIQLTRRQPGIDNFFSSCATLLQKRSEAKTQNEKQGLVTSFSAVSSMLLISFGVTQRFENLILIGTKIDEKVPKWKNSNATFRKIFQTFALLLQKRSEVKNRK